VENILSLIANTDHKTKQPKQFLDEHLVNVSENAMRVAQSLSRLADEMEPAYDIQKLKRKVRKVLNGKISSERNQTISTKTGRWYRAGLVYCQYGKYRQR
jgi:CRISPR-associated endonuclease/helicase Cas3